MGNFSLRQRQLIVMSSVKRRFHQSMLPWWVGWVVAEGDTTQPSPFSPPEQSPQPQVVKTQF